MSRYIDADEFERCLQNYRPYVDSGRFNAIQTEVNQVLDCIEYEIEDAPSIEIIRCSECKYWKSTVQMPNGTEVKCLYGRKADDFCSYGERDSTEQIVDEMLAIKKIIDDGKMPQTETHDIRTNTHECVNDKEQTEREGE